MDSAISECTGEVAHLDLKSIITFAIVRQKDQKNALAVWSRANTGLTIPY